MEGTEGSGLLELKKVEYCSKTMFFHHLLAWIYWQLSWSCFYWTFLKAWHTKGMSNRKVTVLLWKKLGNPVIAAHAVGWNLSEVMSTPNNNQFLDFGYLDGQVFLVGSCCGLLVSETSCEMLGSHVQWRGRTGHEVLTFLGYYRPHIRTVMTLSPNSDSAKRWTEEEEDEIILDIFGVW